MSKLLNSAGKISHSPTYPQQSNPETESVGGAREQTANVPAAVAQEQVTTVPAAVAGEQTTKVPAAVAQEQVTTVPAAVAGEQTTNVPAAVAGEQTANVPAAAAREQDTTVPAGMVQDQTTVASSRQTVEEDFGFEQKRAAAARENVGPLYVEVSRVKKDRGGSSTIYLANGQVWRQIGSDRFFYSERQGRAYLEPGSLNSYFFSQEKINRRIRVKRLQ
jgi:hypothetical protein